MRASPEDLAPMHCWTVEPLSPEVQAALSRLRATEDVVQVAVMPDVHLAQDVCVGTVVATRSLLLPRAVGSDLGCGMAAIGFDCGTDVLGNEYAAGCVLSGLYAAVPVMRHRAASMPAQLPEPLASLALSNQRLEKLKQRDARAQFGTLGRGNHFLEFQADESGRLWLMIHSGSRGIGQAIAAHHLRAASFTATGLARLDAESDPGRAFLADMSWAVAYADMNRRAMISAVMNLMQRLFQARPISGSAIHCQHNHTQREWHHGAWVWAHRKGALSARADEPGVIPGSMGSASFHVLGRGCPEALCSSSHGAGRCLSRTEARRRVSVKSLSRQLQHVWFDHRAAEALLEEAPEAYKDIHGVMRAQRELTRTVRRLTPLLCYKGS